eukprot:TRINITY_DN2_c1_g1_i1.p1 TRINITY_DN2_c1_g1~~TRINITY_DN2_c1_g1_i1.p1  ORF type:complete len:184 (+),score=46.70 TRINITY_DN2_c1_g1_i1:89-640(+)
MNIHNFYVFGGYDVGKTALVNQFVRYQFIVNFDPVVGENDYRKQISVDGESYLLDITDYQNGTSLSMEYFMRSGDGFLIVYSITSRNSFDEVMPIVEEILKTKDVDKYPIVIVGNKCDIEEEREVTTAEGIELAETLGCLFYEISAKTRVNVEYPFYDLIKEIRISQSKELNSDKKKETCLIQ